MDMNSEYVRMIISLMGVLALLLLMVFIIKKFKVAKGNGNQAIKMMNMVSIGPKEKVILIEVKNTTILLGATPNHIETLFVFNDTDEASSKTSQEAHEMKSFSEQMLGLRKSMRDEKDTI